MSSSTTGQSQKASGVKSLKPESVQRGGDASADSGWRKAVNESDRQQSEITTLFIGIIITCLLFLLVAVEKNIVYYCCCY